MYISKIHIRNFRIFDDIGITAYFKKGVNAIISENNCGKTAIVDAIRIAFSTVPYKKDIYFNLSDFHVRNDGKRSDEAFISVYFDEITADFLKFGIQRIHQKENSTFGTIPSKHLKERRKCVIVSGEAPLRAILFQQRFLKQSSWFSLVL